ncbi:PucR family transcriptional regulator [Nocardioides alcanivorans]|uniref:PucR family transcriptional regulator n=1 Tax=Nocardioides alcanivorans TaxID=2897352 RepID=UPI001F428F64|nr:PucR family transcriptional regulator [Nocardioides alcanivorans]
MATDSGLRLPQPVVAAMRTQLSGAAERVVAAVIREVPSYSEPFRGRMGRNIETAVALALGGFLDMASTDDIAESRARVASVFEAAYALGRGEARSGRAMDALAAAYRVGARTAWHELSLTAVEAGVSSEDLAGFAEFVFEYIDQLSAASVSGHADELNSSGRVRERHLERLADSLLTLTDPELLDTLAERADWPTPTTLTALVIPESISGTVRTLTDAHTLRASNAPGLDDRPDLAVLLVPDLSAHDRRSIVQAISDREAAVGPSRPWLTAVASYQRAVRALDLREPHGPVDSDELLASLVVTADAEALADLRARVLAPLADLRPSTVEKLVETLRAWLLHQGRRDDIAAALFVHPQTVRYRVGKLRELYGDRLGDPQFVLEATLALAVE